MDHTHLIRTTVIVAWALALAAMLGWTAAAGGGAPERPPVVADVPLPARTVQSGDVTVTITPRRLDGGGAEFDVSLRTHAADLDLDPAGAAHLTVDGFEWPPPTWAGAGAGGHHRRGVLRFPAGGEARGRVELVITGLPGAVEAEWRLGA